MSNNQNLDNENLEQEQLTDQESKLLEKSTETELLGLLGEEFEKFFNQNSLNYSSPEEVFYAFLKQEGNTDKQKIIETLEAKIGRELNFSDIKNLYLKTGYTIQKALMRKIFKDFKRKKAVKSVLKVMENKINSLLGNNLFLKLNFNEILNQEVNTDDDVEKLFHDANAEFSEILRQIRNAINAENVDEDKKEEYRKLLIDLKSSIVTNEEILNQMVHDGTITEDESKFLNGDTSITNLSNQQKLELHSIFSTLFNGSMITTLNDFINVRNKVSLQIEQFKNLGKIGDIVLPYIENISFQEIDNLYHQYIENNLTDDQKEEILKCGELNGQNAVEVCEKNFKTQAVKELLQKDYWVLSNFLSTKDVQLANIINKIEGKQVLTDPEKEYIFDKIKNNYIEKVVDFIASAYKFDDTEKQTYENLLNQILDTNINTLTLNGINVNVEKEIELPDNIEDIFEEGPRFKLKIKDNIELFRNIFPHYFITINLGGIDKTFSKFSKLRIQKTDGSIKEGYFKECGVDDIVICQNIEDDCDSCEKINISDIQLVGEIEEGLILENGDLPKLFLSSISTLPGRNYEQTPDLLESSASAININHETEEQRQERIRGFNRMWKKFEGDESLNKPEIGDILQIKGQALNIPGFLNNWFYVEITHIDKENGIMKLKVNGGVLDFQGDTEYEKPMTEEFIKELKYNTGGNVLKFEKKDNLEDFANYLSSLQLSSDFQGMKGTLSKWQQNELKVVDGKLCKKNINGDFEPITYMGRTKSNGINNNEAIENAKYRSDLYDVWEIVYENNKVKLKAPEGGFEKEMDLNTFMMIFLQNDLEPWSDKEYRTTKLNFEEVANPPKPKIFYALNDIILAGKNIKDAFLYHFKQDDELRAAMMYENLVKMMPGVWFLKDLKLEASGEKESKIWNVIEQAKSRLERAGEGKGSNHGKKAAEVISEEIFSPVLSGKELSTRHKLKAAGYLLYALEKGPGAYFRKLSVHAGKGLWIKALLGEKHWQKWNTKVTQIKDQLKQDPDNQKLRNELVLSELFYIKDVDTKNLYSARFGPTIEGLAIDVTGSMGKADDAYENEQKKGSYDLIYEGFKSYIANDRPPNAMGALKALSERVETQPQYIDYNKAILLLIFSGYLYNTWGTPYREEFDKICRTYSVPIGLFARKTDGINKVLQMMDYIVKKKNIKPGGKNQSFTEYLYGKNDPDKVDIFEYSNKSKRGSVIEKLEKFWGEYGEDIVFALDYTDNTLISSFEDTNIDEKQKSSIGEYFEYVNAHSRGEDWEISKKTFATSYSPYYQDGVLNINSAAFEHYALSIDDGDFEEKIGTGIWEGLSMKLEGMKDFMYKNETYDFMLKKYMSLFGRYYKTKSAIVPFIQALKSSDKKLLEDTIINHLKHSVGGHYGEIPPEMEEGLEKFVEIFSIKPNNIDKIIENNFKAQNVEEANLGYNYTGPVNNRGHEGDIYENIA